MTAIVLAAAGAFLWFTAMAVVAQRQRVLDRRLARVERALGLRRRPVVHDLASGPPPISDRPPLPPSLRRPPTVQQLAALATPLHRFGG